MPRSRATRAFAMPVLTSRIASSLNSWVYLRRSCFSPFSIETPPGSSSHLKEVSGKLGEAQQETFADAPPVFVPNVRNREDNPAAGGPHSVTQLDRLDFRGPDARTPTSKSSAVTYV